MSEEMPVNTPEPKKPDQPEHDAVIDTMKDAHLLAKNKPATEITASRPQGVVALAILAFMSSAWMMPLALLTDEGGRIALGRDLFFAVLVGVGVVSSIAMWYLRPWAVFTYALAMLLINILFLVSGQWNVIALLIPAAVTVLGLTQLPAMRRRAA